MFSSIEIVVNIFLINIFMIFVYFYILCINHNIIYESNYVLSILFIIILINITGIAQKLVQKLPYTI